MIILPTISWGGEPHEVRWRGLGPTAATKSPSTSFAGSPPLQMQGRM